MIMLKMNVFLASIKTRRIIYVFYVAVLLHWNAGDTELSSVVEHLHRDSKYAGDNYKLQTKEKHACTAICQADIFPP